MGKRFSQAWKRAAAGEAVDETHVTFLTIQTMLETLSPRRLELQRHVRQRGANNVRELAQSLGRDYKKRAPRRCGAGGNGLADPRRAQTVRAMGRVAGTRFLAAVLTLKRLARAA